MKPFAYWFGFEDPTMDDTPEYSNVYYYCCIILSNSEEQAFEWGNVLSTKFLNDGSTTRIEKTWVETVVPHIISNSNGNVSVWEDVKNDSASDFHHLTAECGQDKITLNAIIKASTRNEAKSIWKIYLSNNYENCKIDCWGDAPPVVNCGEFVNW